MEINNKSGIIEIVGDLDIFQARDVKEAIMTIYEKDPRDLTLDFSEVEFLDSTGLGVLISIMKELEEDGNKLEIKNVNKRIEKIFKITELDEVFNISYKE